MHEPAVMRRPTTPEIDRRINDDLTSSMFKTPSRYWMLVAFLALVTAMGFGAGG